MELTNNSLSGKMNTWTLGHGNDNGGIWRGGLGHEQGMQERIWIRKRQERNILQKRRKREVIIKLYIL